MKQASKAFWLIITQAASQSLPLPFAFFYITQILCYLQTISITLLHSGLVKPDEANKMSKALGVILSYMEPSFTFNVLSSWRILEFFEHIFTIYLLLHIALYLCIIFQTCFGKKITSRVSKILSFVNLIHSRLLSFAIHCFFVELIKSNISSTSTKSQMDNILPGIMLLFNGILALVQEMFCYQIKTSKSGFNTKENLFLQLILAQKLTNVPLLYLLPNPRIPVTILNFLFALAEVYVLLKRLPFYNVRMMKLALGFSSAALILSVTLLTRLLGYNGNLIIFLLLALPLVTKLSLARLNATYEEIIRQGSNNPYYAVQFPILLKAYLKNMNNFPAQKRHSKANFYLSAFFKEGMNISLKLEGEKVVDSIKEQIYVLSIERLVELTKKYSYDEILLLNIANLYINKLGNGPKAIYVLNQLQKQNLSIGAENSIHDIHHRFENIYLKASKTRDDINFIKYFTYRNHTTQLKNQIQLEIDAQKKIWETLSENTLDANKIILQAEKISHLTSHIEKTWQREFQDIGKIYINAPILYGLYLDLVQGLPHLGLPMIEKSYNLLLTRNSEQRDILNILKGNSAVIIASIESERMGKIIDASGSLKQLFEIDKENLIDSNIGMILPKTIARGHNKLIKEFQQSFKCDSNKHIVSYVKNTFDRYFPVEVTLSLYPSIQSGMSMMAYVKKLSGPVSLIITDYFGEIIDSSMDIKLALNLHDTTGQINLIRLCPEFIRINQAYNRIYGSEGILFDSEGDEALVLESEGSPRLTKRLSKTRRSIFSMQKTVLSSSRDLLRTLKDDYLFASDRTTNFDPEEPLSPKRPHEARLYISKAEAEKICQVFRDGKQLRIRSFSKSLTPLMSSSVKRTSLLGDNDVLFETTIEPLVFDGELYKVLKLIKSDKPAIIDAKVETMAIQSSSPKKKVVLFDEFPDAFADDFPSEREKEIPNEVPYPNNGMIESLPGSLTIFSPLSAGKRLIEPLVISPKPRATIINLPPQSLEKAKEAPKDVKISSYDYKMPSNEAQEAQLYQLRELSCRTRSNSLNASSRSSVALAKSLNSIFRKKRVSSATRLSILMVYAAICAVIISVLIDMIYSRSSLQALEDAIGLIKNVNLRSFRTVIAWQEVLDVYSHSVDLKPANSSIESEQNLIQENSLAMLETNNLLQGLVNEFYDITVTRDFFEKSVSLWIPNTNETFAQGDIETFTANRLIVQDNLFVANYNGSIGDLKENVNALSAINNTANDFLIAVEQSVNDVEIFFAKIKRNNTNLLIIILAFENIAMAMPFISILVLFKIITNTQSKLFKVLSKAQKRSIDERMQQIDFIASYFSQNIEEGIFSDNNLNSTRKLKAKERGEDARAQFKVRNYSIGGLIWSMMKNLVVTSLLKIFIIVLFIITFATSIKSFNNLNNLNEQIVLSYDLGSQVARILPSFYFCAMFQNQTTFLIKNQLPSTQYHKYSKALDQANERLLSSLSTSKEGISDPVIEDLLKSQLCKYLPADKTESCSVLMDGVPSGLLGLNAKYYQNYVLPMDGYLLEPTFDKAKAIFANYAPQINEIPLVVNAGYEFLAQHLIESFKQEVKAGKDHSVTLFIVNVTAIFLTMLLIRLTILKRYKELDVAVRKTLRIIPYSFIERNKMLCFYLSQEFKNELMEMNMSL